MLFLHREHQKISPGGITTVPISAQSTIEPIPTQLQPDSSVELAANAWCGSATNGYSGINGVGFYQYSDGTNLPPATPRVFHEFSAWVDDFRSGRANMDEGMRLAQGRRKSLKNLIQKNPELALRLGIPDYERDGLPEQLTSLLEEHVGAKADWHAGFQCFKSGQTFHEKFNRVLLEDGSTRKAFTFGRRANLPTTKSVFIHGIAIDDMLAVHESPLRRLNDKEARLRKLDPEGVPVAAAGVALTLADEDAAQTLAEHFISRETEKAYERFYRTSERRHRSGTFAARSGGSNYVLQTTAVSWDAAKAAADLLDLRLAVIGKASENTAVLNVLTGINNNPNGGG
ncbi:MAG: hypothetical protein VB980_02840, partial [Opitutales bacterium]